jgi:hypothetical protein
MSVAATCCLLNRRKLQNFFRDRDGLDLVVFPIAKQLSTKHRPMFVSSATRGSLWIEEFGLTVRYPYLISESSKMDLAEILQERPQQAVCRILFAFQPLSDKECHCLSDLHELSMLDLGGTNVTSKVLESVKQLPEIQTLLLFDTVLDGSSVSLLSAMKSLRTLSIGGTKLSLDDVSVLMKECELENLFAHGLDSTSVNQLSSQTIVVLDLSHNDLRGIRFGEMPKLETLYLIDSKLDDEVIESIRKLKTLRAVFLRRDAFESMQGLDFSKSESIYRLVDDDTKILWNSNRLVNSLHPASLYRH